MALKWSVRPLTSPEEAKGTGWHHYTESGLDNVWLRDGVERHETLTDRAFPSRMWTG